MRLTQTRLCIALCLGAFCLAEVTSAAELARATPLQPRASREVVLTPYLQNYCYDCHQGDDAAAGLSLEKLNASADLTDQRRRWLHVLTRLRTGDMPPADAEQPPQAERAKLIEWLDAELNSLDCDQPLEAHPTALRRLSRAEYAQTVHDLTGVSLDVEELFPRDELAHGYDNNADALSFSPLLVEKYLDAAEQISLEAIRAPEQVNSPSNEYDAADLDGGIDIGSARLMAVNSRVSVRTKLLKPGHYVLRARVYATQVAQGVAQMRLSLGNRNQVNSSQVYEVRADQNDPLTLSLPFEAKAGDYRAAAEFINDAYEPNADHDLRDRNLYVMSLSVIGPIERPAIGLGLRKVAGLPGGVQWPTSTRSRVERLTWLAFRRPGTQQEVDRYQQLLAAARRRGDSYPRAMQHLLQALLASPHFLFRGEPAGTDAIDDYQLAMRLSYLLTSSMPDAQLRKAAKAGQLRQQLDQHIDRLLDSPRSDRFVRNFSEQWLEIRRLEGMQRDPGKYPGFDSNLADAMREETFLYLRDMLRNDRPLTWLLDGQQTFVNQRLAKHYGIPFPPQKQQHGKQTYEAFLPVQLPADRRAGLLTQASVLTVASHVDRSSPVLRGKWVMEHLLNDPPPDPPPGVSDLAAPAEGEPPKSLRAQLELHRADPNCAACHVRMDPLGFALEQYDAIGRWREHDAGLPIDTRAELPDGRQLVGADGLKQVLLADFASVRRALAANLLTYALGRGLEYHDECALDAIVDETVASGDTLSAMLRAVVHSKPFLREGSSHRASQSKASTHRDDSP